MKGAKIATTTMQRTTPEETMAVLSFRRRSHANSQGLRPATGDSPSSPGPMSMMRSLLIPPPRTREESGRRQSDRQYHGTASMWEPQWRNAPPRADSADESDSPREDGPATARRPQ